MTSHSRTPHARVCRGSAALVALCALAASCHIPSTRSARPLGSHVPSIGVQAGYRYFTNDTLWAPDKQQPTVGASLDWRNVDGGLGFSVGGYASRSESGGRQDTTLEPYFGIRWDLGDWTTRLRPYLGVGYSWIFARQEQAGRTVTDDSLAMVHETADLWFHTLVMLAERGLGPEHVLRELRRRFGQSGHEEKASRG